MYFFCNIRKANWQKNEKKKKERSGRWRKIENKQRKGRRKLERRDRERKSGRSSKQMVSLVIRKEIQPEKASKKITDIISGYI